MATPRDPSIESSTKKIHAAIGRAANNLDAALVWVKHGSTQYNIFSAQPLLIQAPIKVVMKWVKSVGEYNNLSHGAVSASVQGEPLPGKRINLVVNGKLHSEETITIVDDDKMIIGWECALLWGILGTTERYQVLEKVSETETLSYIAVNIPCIVGVLSKWFLHGDITTALDGLNKGIKQKSEEEVKSSYTLVT